jgi:hypothetical protein
MRFLMTAKIPHKEFNAAVKDGTAGAKLKRILDALKPEAVYFTALSGFRTAVIIVDMPDASKMPALAEPFFLTFSADVEFHPVMTAADLAKGGLDALGQLWA